MLQIRVMRQADVPVLVELWVCSWAETIPDIDFEARRGWIAAFLVDPTHNTLVAGREAALGFVSVQGRVLHQIAVAPRAKGSGVAAALVAAAKARSPGKLDLEVNRDNPRAIRFYEREGFVTTGEATNPSSRRPTLTMTWSA